VRSFTFNGHNCMEYGIACSGEATFDAPARDVSAVSIPGRNGDLIFDNGRFKNINVEYPAFFVGNFPGNVAAARAWLLGPHSYQRLTDDYHPGEFRLGVYTGGLSFEPTAWNLHAETEITFNCKPQRFLEAGELTTLIVNGGAITNPTAFDALPIISITGTGDATLTINGSTIAFTGLTGGAILDSEEQDASYGGLSVNNLMTGDFPVLMPGSNSISWTGGITSVEITPRWWTI